MTFAQGIGLMIVMMDGETLGVWHPRSYLETMASGEDADLLETFTTVQDRDDARQVRTIVITCKADLGNQPQFTVDTYLRLRLLSYRLAKPNMISLDGIVSRLPNVVWAAQDPYATEDFEETRLRLRTALGHPVVVLSVDKFPAMVHYVVPEGVYIADGMEVRLDVYLAERTSVMHATFINYNADAFGRCTVEGCISQGVVIDDGSDVSDGASTMGTLSDDSHNRVRLDKRCLPGANSGLGVPLGDNCVVEAGLFLTTGAKVVMMEAGGVVPGAYGLLVGPPCVLTHTLTDTSNVLFRRNPQLGRIEALSCDGKSTEVPEDANPRI